LLHHSHCAPNLLTIEPCHHSSCASSKKLPVCDWHNWRRALLPRRHLYNCPSDSTTKMLDQEMATVAFNLACSTSCAAGATQQQQQSQQKLEPTQAPTHPHPTQQPPWRRLWKSQVVARDRHTDKQADKENTTGHTSKPLPHLRSKLIWYKHKSLLGICCCCCCYCCC
jgi:hypothetical protein